MKLSDKLKKLRADNNLTQEEFAKKLYVTRTAVSKWETDKGYPSIDSIKLICRLFDMSIDQLLSDEDIENQKLLDDRKARDCYYIAAVNLILAFVFTLTGYFTRIAYLYIVSCVAVLIFAVFAILAKPRYKREQSKKQLALFIVSRLVVSAVLLCAIYGFFAITI